MYSVIVRWFGTNAATDLPRPCSALAVTHQKAFKISKRLNDHPISAQTRNILLQSDDCKLTVYYHLTHFLINWIISAPSITFSLNTMWFCCDRGDINHFLVKRGRSDIWHGRERTDILSHFTNSSPQCHRYIYKVIIQKQSFWNTAPLPLKTQHMQRNMLGGFAVSFKTSLFS